MNQKQKSPMMRLAQRAPGILGSNRSPHQQSMPSKRFSRQILALVASPYSAAGSSAFTQHLRPPITLPPLKPQAPAKRAIKHISSLVRSIHQKLSLHGLCIGWKRVCSQFVSNLGR